MKERLVLNDYNNFGGKHCQTTAIKSILGYNNLNLREEMLLGLGGGLGFIYWYMKNMPAPFIGGRTGGRNEEFMVNMLKRIGGNCEVYRSGSPKRGYEELKKILRNKQPAYVYGDMAYLPYMAIPEDAHFGYHTFVVYGIDEETNTVYVGDRGKNGVNMSIDDLNLARNSKFPPFPPKNQLLKISLPDEIIDLRPGILEAIRDCVYQMMNPPIRNFGLAGIKKWASLVPKWPKMFKGSYLFNCIFNVFIYIEIGGTGGSSFRPMYADFLREAAILLEKPSLEKVASLFECSANIWSEIAALALPDSWPSLARIRELGYEKNRIFEKAEPSALTEMQGIGREMVTLMQTIEEDLETKNISRLLEELRDGINKLYIAEEIAFKTLAEVIQ
ncbi:MAG: BtrH N-terminal domain-containing protein [Candidatus Thermoplasmatota archaeon]|jgi:hypothetical protein|nr:BtrH N-terminal domain-containing protein [Candidatus Thermoplasmatota archaeon]MDP7264026.1 BtrH N-terminal domain-containing protein [Candidatus Thermoplasmatota archaeon]